MGGSWAEVSTVAKAKSAGVEARESRMVLPGDQGRGAAEEEDFAAALGQGFEAVEFGLGEDRGGGNDDCAVTVAAQSFEAAGAGFEVGGEGVHG